MTGEPHRPDQTEICDVHHVKVAPVQPRPVAHVDDNSTLPVALYSLCFLAFVVGIVAGLGAVAFPALIGLVHNAFFSRHFSFAYDASRFTPAAPWGVFVVLVPVVGGLAVTWIVSTFAPEAKGHGVPEVMDTIYYKRGVICSVVAVVKSIASALAIGSALGSTLGQLVTMTTGQRIKLRRRRSRLRHCGDLQYTDRWGSLPNRTDDAGNQCQHVPAGGDCNRYGHLSGPAIFLAQRRRSSSPRSWVQFRISRGVP